MRISIIIILPNALCTEAFELETKNAEQTTFSRLPREYAEMDTQAFKGELGTMRDVLGEIQMTTKFGEV